ncbi:MAG: hypothetical protein GTO63_19615, partial [Anaerolineae bacterium]|nr:hypothetical protein [Anaerolineae bacterium]
MLSGTPERGESIGTTFKTALIQAAPELGNKAANLKRMRKLVSATEADLYLFGELYLTGYMCKDLFPELGEDLRGPSVNEVRKIAEGRNASIIFGMPERDEETGVLYNSSVYVSSDGDVVGYRKLYPANFGPFEELQYFRRGSELKVV